MTNYAQKHTFRANTFKAVSFRSETLAGGITSLLITKSPVIIEYTQIIETEKNIGGDWGTFLISNKIHGVDWVKNLSRQNTHDVDWLFRILQTSIINKDWISKLSATTIFDIDYPSFLLQSSSINTDWGQFILNQHLYNTDWISKLSQSGILNIDFTQTINLITNILSLAYLQGILTSQRINVDFGGRVTQQVLADRDLLVDWLQGLMEQKKNMLDWAAQLSIISRILNIEYNSFLLQQYFTNTDFLQTTNFGKIANLDYISKVTGIKTFTINWDGQVVYLLIPQAFNIDYNSFLQQSIILGIDYRQILSIVKNFDIDFAGQTVVQIVSADSIFNIDWWLRPSSASGIWILDNRETSWILDARGTEWILTALPTSWNLGARSATWVLPELSTNWILPSR